MTPRRLMISLQKRLTAKRCALVKQYLCDIGKLNEELTADKTPDQLKKIRLQKQLLTIRLKDNINGVSA